MRCERGRRLIEPGPAGGRLRAAAGRAPRRRAGSASGLVLAKSFRNEVVAAATSGRLVHHAEILALGESPRLGDKGLAPPGPRVDLDPACSPSPYGLSSAGGSPYAWGVTYQPAKGGDVFQAALTLRTATS